MSEDEPAWFVGAWRRRSIVVPGGEPTEPCEAWWIQAGEAFVDVRVAAPGMEDNGLPYPRRARSLAASKSHMARRVACRPRFAGSSREQLQRRWLYIDEDDPCDDEDAPGAFGEWCDSRTHMRNSCNRHV